MFKERDYLNEYKQYVFFYNGFLSNWADTPFLDPKSGIPYNCSEQYMMHQKALLFNDHDIAMKVLKKKFPGDQKALGRKVKGFDKEIWDKHARNIVYQGCFYKFTQNEDAYNYLMETKGYYLVEASPYDTVWGVGLGGYDEAIQDPKNWQGTNWLGQVLTSLREDLAENPDAVLF
jgi:hypothetical protein